MGASMGAEETVGRPASAAGPFKRLWIFDFDGTLAPLVPDREAARLHPSCLELLRDLTAIEDQRTAILSSRQLEDLAPRVPVPGILLGGGSGVAWQTPDGRRDMPPPGGRNRLHAARARLRPLLDRVARLPGVDIEDKQWSIAIHFRAASSGARQQLEAWMAAEPTNAFRGPEVFEIPLLPEIDKAFGVKNLCRLLHVDPHQINLVYAGDDTNDLVAMRWVLEHNGTAFFVRGTCPIPGPLLVKDPASLAQCVRNLLKNSGPASSTGCQPS